MLLYRSAERHLELLKRIEIWPAFHDRLDPARLINTKWQNRIFDREIIRHKREHGVRNSKLFELVGKR
jgi:hypothetical protein